MSDSALKQQLLDDLDRLSPTLQRRAATLVHELATNQAAQSARPPAIVAGQRSDPSVYEHLEVDEHGVAWIRGANTKVVEIVAEVKAYGWSPEELAYQHPHLTLAQVHSALAYYWDHSQEIDADLRKRQDLAEAIRQEVGEHPLAAKLRARKQA